MKLLEMRFDEPLTPPWRVTEIGQGKVTTLPDALRLVVPASPGSAYHDAQISDYSSGRDFRWRPPVQLTVRARMQVPSPPTPFPSGEGSNNTSLISVVGTAGFGFWNHPFVPGERGFRLPQAVWFFFSAPPNNMQLAKGVAGPGWKAATLDAKRWQFLALAPTAPLGILLMRIPAVYERLWPIGQRALGVSEAMLDTALLGESHTYTLDWRADGVTFEIDGAVVHESPFSPRGPLGFVAWVDNQYAIVTPQGHFGFGVSPVEREQAMVVESVSIVSG